MDYGSKQITAAAVKIAVTETRAEEDELKKKFHEQGIKCAAIDYGGEFLDSIPKIHRRNL